MTAEFGVFLLALAFMTACAQSLTLIPALRTRLAAALPAAALLQALCITLALIVLITLRLDSDFSVANVAAHSNLTLPLLYKIAGSWGNHEGSLLLWVWVLTAFGALLILTSPSPGRGEGRGGGYAAGSEYSTSPHPNPPPCRGREYIAPAIAIQSLLCAGFLLFILFTSNPFARLFPPPPDGEALNPLLQDMALSIHPPLLYLGYVGFSIVFSLSAAALLQGRMGRDWARLAHPWILASWSALTLGIGLGSWWAYRTLGWGGFWFWDPVENASLLPWLSGTALLHSNIVLKKRGQLAQWVALLAIITFGLSLLGTFLTRSGVLISVHSFASDPARGFFILAYMGIALGGALLLFALRAGKLTQDDAPLLPLSREGMIVINNLFLLTACATVLLGTLYPLLADWAGGERLTVGPPYFNATFLPLMALPLIFAGLAPFFAWRKASLKRALKQTSPAMLASASAMLLLLSCVHQQTALATIGFSLSTWLAAASLRWLIGRQKRLRNWPVFLAHFGAASLVAGITGMGLWQQEASRWLSVGDSIDVAGYRAGFTRREPVDAPNYSAMRGQFAVTDANGDAIAGLSPEYRLYAIRKSATSRASIHSLPLGDLYMAMGETSPETGQTAVRLYYNPMIGLIWGGCVLMALGGITALLAKNRAPHPL